MRPHSSASGASAPPDPLGRRPAPGDDPLCRVVLVEPLIPENTGNVARTCVGTSSELHLVRPLGFEITESRVKRAGLDYWPHLSWQMHESFEAWQAAVTGGSGRAWFVETEAKQSLYDVEIARGDWVVFGKETSGLGAEFIAANESRSVRLPMPGPVRSLNLSNAVAVVVFELLRQTEARKAAEKA